MPTPLHRHRPLRAIVALVAASLVVTACSAGSSDPVGLENPERAVVAWFEAIDEGDAAAAARAVDDRSLAIILSIENDLDEATTAEYLTSGVPAGVHATYWESFSDGFSEFASRPISTLTVGQSELVEVEDATFARVAISSGPSAESIVFVREADDGSWQVDMVATLGDGFSALLADAYDALGSEASGQVIRDAYLDTVAPAFWAAVADGAYGEDFDRVALTLLGQLDP